MRFFSFVLAIVIAVFSMVPPACPGEKSVMLPDTELIDQPTAGILDYYGFLAKTRFFLRRGSARLAGIRCAAKA